MSLQHIEFMGPPGAGKSRLHEEFMNIVRDKSNIISSETALYNAVKDNLHSKKKVLSFIKLLPHHVVRPILSLLSSITSQRLKQLANFELSNPDLYNFVLKKLKSNKRKNWDRETLNGINLFCSLYSLISQNRLNQKYFVIFDEGFFQRGFSILGTNPLIKPKRKDIAYYIDHMPLPKIVMYISADPHTCINRMNKRNYSFRRIEKLSTEEIIKIMENNKIYSGFVIKELKKRNIPVLEIKNNNLKRSIKQLQKIAKDYL